MRGRSFLSNAVLSHHVAVGGDIFLGGVKPWVWIFDVVLTVWILVLPNLTWRSTFLPGSAYLASELS
jgi:hypothetical protein